MDKQELVAEEEYLAKTITLIKDKLEKNEKLMAETKGGVSDLISYISTQFYDLDPEERSSLSQFMGDGDYALSEALRLNAILKRQKSSPYFGRFDFFSDDEKTANSYYLGINSLCEDGNSIPTICDWRAPISTMYYDFEKGRGFYDAPIGRIDGEILLKRQYKIKNGKMNYCFDSNLTIDDEILQEALSHASDSKMKNIVTTIQKEQNQIIRSDLYNTLVVQGVAGSGKTSIALHRVAFLLYKYKQKIRSKDILIISPNKIFSDYISNVLPELGEANVEETTFFELAREELKDICIFEDRADMQNAVLFGDEKRIAEIQTKNGKDFFEKLEKYLRESITFSFDAEDIKVGDKTIGKEKIDSLYRERYSGKDVSLRIEWIAEYVVDQLDVKAENPIGMIARIKNKLLKMFKENSILKLYALFLKSEGLEYLTNESNLVRFEDVCPILFIKDYMLGIQKYKNVKYVIIDEMQDYGLMAFVIMNKMFNCPKTVLGDIFQSIERKVEKEFLSDLTKLFGENTVLLDLKKSYRSTMEIAKFAQGFLEQCNAENVSRHGAEPQKIASENFDDMILQIKNKLSDKSSQKYTRRAIITKTDEEAKKIAIALEKVCEVSLIEMSSQQIPEGNIVISAPVSKGLEFDLVIVPNYDNINYKTEIDKNSLYISCTRALHELMLCYFGQECELNSFKESKI